MSSHLLTKSCNYFAAKYVPSIKFLGSRALLDKKEHPKPTSTQTVSKQNLVSQIKLSNLSHLPGMRIPSVRGVLLSQFESEVVNSGGFCDESSKKVKAIRINWTLPYQSVWWFINIKINNTVNWRVIRWNNILW